MCAAEVGHIWESLPVLLMVGQTKG